MNFTVYISTFKQKGKLEHWLLLVLVIASISASFFSSPFLVELRACDTRTFFLLVFYDVAVMPEGAKHWGASSNRWG